MGSCYSSTVSLDGLKESHSWLRGNEKSYDRVLTALSILSALPISHRDVVTCVNPRNLNELDALSEILIEYKVPSWRLFRIFPIGRAKNNSELLLDPVQTRHMIDWIASHKKALRKKGLDVSFSCEGYLPLYIDKKIRTQPFFCRAGVNITSILADGRITGCSNNADCFTEGNIATHNLAYLWEHEFKKFRHRSWIDTTSCGTCTDLKSCKGSSIHIWDNTSTKPAFCYKECF